MSVPKHLGLLLVSASLAVSTLIGIVVLTGGETSDTDSLVAKLENPAEVVVDTEVIGPTTTADRPTLGVSELAPVKVTLALDGFEFAGTDQTDTASGHVHIYANDKLMGTAVTNEYYLELPPGDWVVRAVAANLSHVEYTYNDQLVAGEDTVVISPTLPASG